MKRTIGSVAIIVVVIAGSVMTYAIWNTMSTSPEEYLESGIAHYREGEYSRAIVQLLNAVQRGGATRDARYYLSASYFRTGDLTSAARELNALLESHPGDIEASLELGNIFLAAGPGDADMFGEAMRIAGKVLEVEPNNVAALVLSGNASAGLEDYRTSVEQFERAVGLDPNNTSAFISMGTSLTLQTDYERAERAFQRAREIAPDNRSVLVSLGNFYRALGRMDEAETVLEHALALDPVDPQVLLQVVEFYNQLGRFQDVERLLVGAQKEMPGDPTPSLLLADLYPGQDREAEALELLLKLRSQFPDNLIVAARLAMRYLQDQPELARAQVDAILESQPDSPIGHILLGELQFLSGATAEAEDTFARDVAVNSPYPQPHFFLGQIAGGRGDTETAAREYRRALEMNAGYLPARIALAEVLLGAGHLDEARGHILAIVDAQPNSMQARLLKAALDRASGDLAQAERELISLSSEQPDNPLVHRQMAQLHESRGDTVRAEQSLRRATDLLPDSRAFLQELTEFYLRSELPDRAIATLDSLPDADKDAIHYELLGVAYNQRGDLEAAEGAYLTAARKDPNRLAPHVYLMTRYLQSRRTDQAQRELDQLLRINPSDPQLYAVRGLIYESEGNLDEAMDHYSEALELDPNQVSSANNLAYLLAEQERDLDAALRWAQVARRNAPDNPSTADTLGWVHYKLGSYILARDQLQFAVSRQPNHGTFQYHLGMIYMETGQLEQAAAALERAAGDDDFADRALARAAIGRIEDNR